MGNIIIVICKNIMAGMYKQSQNNIN